MTWVAAHMLMQLIEVCSQGPYIITSIICPCYRLLFLFLCLFITYESKHGPISSRRGAMRRGNLAARSLPGRRRRQRWCIETQADIELISRSGENVTSPNTFFLNLRANSQKSPNPLLVLWRLTYSSGDKVYIRMFSFIYLSLSRATAFYCFINMQGLARGSLGAGALVMPGTEDMMHKHK